MRKTLKKIFSAVAIAILLCGIGCYAFVKYKQHRSYTTTSIPKNAASLIRIDVYRIYTSLLPGYFGRKKRAGAPLFEGLVVPANIFLYTVKGRQPTTVFSSLELNDAVAFEASLKKQKNLIRDTGKMPGIEVWTSSDKLWTIAFNQKQVAIAYAIKKEPVLDMLTDILLNKNTITVSNSKFRTIKDQEGHIAYLSGGSNGVLECNKGNITASLNISGMGADVPSSVQLQQFDNKNVINMWLYGDLKPWLHQKNFSSDTIMLNGDSLLASHPKGIEIALGQSVLQKDSVVTYEYNDDFEKVPTVTVHETTVPGLFARAVTDPDLLKGYLQRQNIISRDSGLVNKKIFPLYQLYTAQTKEFLQWSTVKGSVFDNTLSTSSNAFFGLQVNFERLSQQQEFALIHGYLKSLKTFNAKGIKTGQDEVRLDAILYFKDSKSQVLWQLLDML